VYIAGSDVSGLTATAVKSPDGTLYTINGEKKWITQGKWATHALVAARTGSSGAKGLSVFIVPMGSKGISKRKIENSGVNASGKNFILFFLFPLHVVISSSVLTYSCRMG
jgi:alkylation response protein AidB-like acyl-CoA dehydrogenase